jgi:hypothetical protein
MTGNGDVIGPLFCLACLLIFRDADLEPRVAGSLPPRFPFIQPLRSLRNTSVATKKSRQSQIDAAQCST